MQGLSQDFPASYNFKIPSDPSVAPQQRFSLSKMNEGLYLAWQQWIREMSPEKPVLVDVTWALNRAMSGDTDD